jgi:protein NrfD
MERADRTVGARGDWKKALPWIVWGGLFLVGLYGVFQRIGQGHELAGYGSYVPWGLWIGLYFLGVGISGGVFVIGAGGFILGWPGFSRPSELRRAIVLSVAAIVPAFLGVALDLGRPERLFSILWSPSFTSMMAFNAWMYNAFLLMAGLGWLFSFRPESAWLKPLLILGGFFSILFPSQSGVFFEAVRTNDFWQSPILSVLFLASAIALGGAALLVIRFLPSSEAVPTGEAFDRDPALERLRVITLGGIAVYIVFEFAEFSIAVWTPAADSPNVAFLLFGEYWWVFWIVHILVGVLAAMAFLATPAKKLWFLGALLAILGFGAARMGVLVPGQIAGQIPGLAEAFRDPRLVYSYHPTSMEYQVGCFMVALGVSLFYIGNRLNRMVAKRFPKA